MILASSLLSSKSSQVGSSQLLNPPLIFLLPSVTAVRSYSQPSSSLAQIPAIISQWIFLSLPLVLPKLPFSHSRQIYLWKCKSYHMDTSAWLKHLSGFLLNNLHFPVACRVLPGLGLADCSWVSASTAASSCHLMHTLLLPLKLTRSSHLSPLRFSQAPALSTPFTPQTQHIYHLLRKTFLTPLPIPPLVYFAVSISFHWQH